MGQLRLWLEQLQKGFDLYITDVVGSTLAGRVSVYLSVWRLRLALILAFGWAVLPTTVQAQFCTDPMTVGDSTKKAKKKDVACESSADGSQF